MKCVFDSNGLMFLVCKDDSVYPEEMEYVIVPDDLNITKTIIHENKEILIEVNKQELEQRLSEYLLNYSNARKLEYPKIEDQLDMIYWDRVNGTNNWENLISKIKEDNPKN
jgi:hypothetical protein